MTNQPASIGLSVIMTVEEQGSKELKWNHILAAPSIVTSVSKNIPVVYKDAIVLTRDRRTYPLDPGRNVANPTSHLPHLRSYHHYLRKLPQCPLQHGLCVPSANSKSVSSAITTLDSSLLLSFMQELRSSVLTRSFFHLLITELSFSSPSAGVDHS